MSIELSVPQGLNDVAQFVQDEDNNRSPLAIGTGPNVGIGTAEPQQVLTVEGDISFAPVMGLRSNGNEASIRYAHEGGFGWHVGSGGGAGAQNFFFWNQESHIVIKIQPDGTMLLKGGLIVEGPVQLKGEVSVGELTADTVRAKTLLVNAPDVP